MCGEGAPAPLGQAGPELPLTCRPGGCGRRAAGWHRCPPPPPGQLQPCACPGSWSRKTSPPAPAAAHPRSQNWWPEGCVLRLCIAGQAACCCPELQQFVLCKGAPASDPDQDLGLQIRCAASESCKLSSGSSKAGLPTSIKSSTLFEEASMNPKKRCKAPAQSTATGSWGNLCVLPAVVGCLLRTGQECIPAGPKEHSRLHCSTFACWPTSSHELSSCPMFHCTLNSRRPQPTRPKPQHPAFSIDDTATALPLTS
jgi:hypothetical protein